MSGPDLIDLLLRGIAVGAQLGLGVALARSASSRSLRIATLALIGANIAFILNGIPEFRQLLGPYRIVPWTIQIASPGYLWLFVATLFEDRDLDWRLMIPAGVLTVVGFAAQFGPASAGSTLWALHNLLGLAISAHALITTARSGRIDLIEARRRLRVPFIIAIAGFSIAISAAQLAQAAGFTSAWYETANALLQAALGVAGVAVLLEARPVIFGRAEAATAPVTESDDALWLARLETAMRSDGLWRREGLTIAEVAQAVGLPEYRLRRLINDRLGHRNFAAFVNQQRIEAAKALLADPDHAARTIASIAFDLGFGSLGPFNRTFRDATGLTPSDFRRRAFAELSPNPENAR